jgi:DNA-directed RNA polymerase specialized sigma24 family protein
MADPAGTEVLTLAGLAHRCAQETQRFFQRLAHDTRYCFELFRRAICGRNQQAWHLVYRQYEPLIAGWVRRHAAFPAVAEEVPFFVNRALEKMWSALTPARFEAFPDLPSLLRYLQMCVHSVLIDEVRRAEPALLLDDLPLAAHSLSGSSSPDQQALDDLQRRELWQAVEARLQTEQERRVLYASFVLGLKPREICAQFSTTFRDVHEVYRVKENLLARLRRDTQLQDLLRGGA